MGAGGGESDGRGRAPLPLAMPWHGASEALIAAADDPWITPAEAAGFDDTPDQAATLAWLDRLAAASPLVRVTTFGTSCEGRPLTLVIASERVDDPLAGPRDRPRLLVQCGIHPGEIDGKDAGLMLLRDIALRGKRHLLAAADWFFVPILNPDGHERRSAFARPNQRGPDLQGWRTNAQNLNLNRDYMKADAPETAALLALIGRIDPDLYIDLHVTDGLDYQYDITYGFQDRPYACSPAISDWLHDVARPAIGAALREGGHCPGPLILARDDRDPARGLYLPAFPPRFSHAYGDCRGLATILVENHSLKPVRRRVLGTYALIEGALALVGRDGAGLRAAIDADRARRPATVVTGWVDRDDPVRAVNVLGVAHTFYRSPASGSEEVRWLGTPAPPAAMPLYGSRPAREATIPAAWWILPGEREAIDRLARHGIACDHLDETLTREVEVTRITAASLAPMLAQRRPVLTARTWRRDLETVVLPRGSVRVTADQPLVTLAAMLLEPTSADSFFAYGMIAGLFDRTDYLEPYVVAPMADRMLEEDDALRAAFARALDADPVFAADPMARLAWFYGRSRYADPVHAVYPVLRERMAR